MRGRMEALSGGGESCSKKRVGSWQKEVTESEREREKEVRGAGKREEDLRRKRRRN